MTAMVVDFLGLPEIGKLAVTERFVVLLWWHHQHSAGTPVEFNQLCQELYNAGYAEINKSREKKKLAKDTRTVRPNGGTAFRLNIKAVQSLDDNYLVLLENPPAKQSNVLFAMNDFINTKLYMREVVRQANISYDMQLYDCCAVMIRRLLEALIIEAYLKAGRQDEIKETDGDYKMFNGLLTHINKDAKSLGLGRNTPKHLKDTKELADKSAHAINFNVKKKLIDDKKHDFQLAVAELKQFAFDN